jgi:predicted AAA+ superfamily ATPase
LIFFIRVISAEKLEANKVSIYIRERYIEKVRPWIGKPIIKILTGMRRTGKSTILSQLAQELRAASVTVLELNLELLAWEHLQQYRALHDWVVESSGGGRVAILIDEVQECIGWEEAVNSLLAMGRFDIYLTGSNAKLLSSELATKIAGRYVELSVFGFGFAEHLALRQANVQGREEEFARYVRFGGLPGLHHFGISEAPEYLSSLYNTILLRDIVERHQVRDVQVLDRIIRFVFDNIGNVTTAIGISKYLKSQQVSTSVNTVQTYLGYLEECFAIHRIRRFDIKGKQYLEQSDKYYAGDIGLRYGILGYNDRDIAGLLKNIVCLELLRRGYSVSVGKIGTIEIDFIGEDHTGRRCYIQVCYLLASPETVEREFGALEKIKDNHPKFVISMDPIPYPGRNGIIWRKLDQFLIDSDW